MLIKHACESANLRPQVMGGGPEQAAQLHAAGNNLTAQASCQPGTVLENSIVGWRQVTQVSHQ